MSLYSDFYCPEPEIDHDDLARRGKWMTGELIADMSTAHIRNCVKWIHRNDASDDEIDAYLPVLTKELRKRQEVGE